MSSDSCLYRGKHLEFFLTPGGWEYVGRTGSSRGVAVVAVTPQSRLLLVEQMRPPLHGTAIELPAGLVAESEDDCAAIQRELIEETGYTCASVEFLCGGPTSAGLTSETNAIFLARGVAAMDGTGDDPVLADGSVRHTKLRGLAEEGEKIVVHEVPLAGVIAWLGGQRQRGALIDLKIYAGLFFVPELRG